MKERLAERPPAARAMLATPRADFTIEASSIVATLLAFWIGVALAKNVGLFSELLALGRVKRRAIPLDEARTAMLGAWRANAGKRRCAVLASSDDVDVPCAAGLRAPAILLPTSVVESASSADIDRIAMHEFAHLWRFDDWTNFAERLIGATLWFNPAIALAKRRIAIEREIACDDWVVARTGSAHGYASCLFRLAEASLGGRTPTHALGALGNPRNITSRIEHLLCASNAPRKITRTLPIALSIVGFAVVTGQALRAPAIAVEVPVAATPVASMAPAVAPIAAPIVTPNAKARTHALPVALNHPKRHIIVLISDDKSAPVERVLPRLPNLSKIERIVMVTPSVPPMEATPAMPEVQRPPDEGEFDAAAAQLRAAADRLAEHALDRAERNESAHDRTRRLADEADERAAERQMRDATRQFREREQIRYDVESARRSETNRVAKNREQVRAALEIVRQSERNREESIENALRGVREELEREGLETPHE